MRMSDLDIPKSEIEHLIEEYVYVARNKSIFYRKLEGNTYEEVAEEFNLSTQQAKTIVRDCLNTISKHF